MTENGWPPNTDAAPFVSIPLSACVQVTIPGTTETLWFQKGAPATILPAFMAALNQFIEPALNSAGYGDEGSWTNGNSVGTSNHLGATAFDYNWEDHPMGPAPEDPSAGWQGSTLIDGDEVPAVQALLDWFEGTVYWGGNWDSPKDSMHFQMGYGTYDPNGAGGGTDAVNDFIRRKILPSGFSTYSPAGIVASQPPAQETTDAAQVLADATGVSLNFALSILPEVSIGLQDSQCTNVNRIAMWLAQIGEESAGFTATVEIGDIDGTTYQGRTWIQITGPGNYGEFSQWAFSQGLVDSPTYFVDNPGALGDAQWAAIGPAWYWTVARPQINGLCDAGDIVGVTEAINGGTNGLDVRTQRWLLALSQGDALLTLIDQEEDDMSGWTQDQIDRALLLMENQTGVMRPSLSRFRYPGEGPVNTCGGFAWTADGNVHEFSVAYLATQYGDPQSILLLWQVAQDTDPARAVDTALAERILEHVDKADIDNASTVLASWLAAEAGAK